MTDLNQHQWSKHIERTYPSATRARALALFRKQHVKAISGGWREGNQLELKANVIGSQGDRYRATLRLAETKLTSECSCYMYLDCKHGAALVVAQDFGRLVSVEPEDPLEQWLDKLRSIRLRLMLLARVHFVEAKPPLEIRFGQTHAWRTLSPDEYGLPRKRG